MADGGAFIDDGDAGSWAEALRFPPFIADERDGTTFRNIAFRSHPAVNDAPAVTDQRPLDAGERSGDCPSCGGLNLSCPDGCGRDPRTGELNGTRFVRCPERGCDHAAGTVCAYALCPGKRAAVSTPFHADGDTDV